MKFVVVVRVSPTEVSDCLAIYTWMILKWAGRERERESAGRVSKVIH